ncbi:MAG TPA: hypothetical protein VJT73_08020 [Polyangiaceae bacterium]|nr:hypothetical protein [Polyangiaceae bacterium]
MRSPMILGLVSLLVLIALPLYLLRKPKPITPLDLDAGARGDVADAGAVDAAPSAAVASDAGSSKRMTLGDPKTIRCTPKGGGRITTDRCDHLASLEDLLARAIRDNIACAPPAAAPYTVSFVLSVDFDRKKFHVWAGRSGSLKKRNAGDLIRCVEHGLAQPDWGTIAHQFSKYDINVMAAYPASGVPLGGT